MKEGELKTLYLKFTPGDKALLNKKKELLGIPNGTEVRVVAILNPIDTYLISVGTTIFTVNEEELKNES